MRKILYVSSIISIIFLQGTFAAADWTITTSGTYILNDDIVDSIGDAIKGTINIESSYVTLDLSDRVIQQTSSGGTAAAIGIVVNSGVTDVLIKNGTIRNFLRSGIKVNPSCRRISLRNIVVEACGVRGIEFVGGLTTPILSSEIKDCRLFNCCSDATADNVIRVQAANGMVIENVVMDSNHVPNVGVSPTTGLNIDGSSYCYFKNIYYVNNNGKTTGGNSMRGFFTTSLNGPVKSNVFENCQVSNNNISTVSGSGAMHGFILNASSNNILNNCLVSTCSAGGALFGFWNSTATSSNNVYNKCVVIGNAGSNTTSGIFGGFVVGNSSKNCVLTDCAVIGNYSKAAANGGLPATAFRIDGASTFNFLRRCIAADNISTTTLFSGFSLVGANNSNNYFKECVATNNTGRNDASSSGIRWDSTGVNNVFVKNIAARNGSTANTENITGTPPFPPGSKTAVTSSTMSTPNVPWSNLSIAS